MKLKFQETLDCDVLVVGAGGAGLRAAIAAKNSRADVLLVSKSKLGRATNTYISKAIIATSGWVPEDGEDILTDDTMAGGRFLNDRSKVSVIAERLGTEISFLKECGVRFGMRDGKPRLMKIPGHRHARHVYGENLTGSDLVLPLIRRVGQMGIRTRDHVFVTRILTSAGNIAGAAGITPDGDFVMIRAKAIVLATGGYAQIFLNTNNASGITGDGLALAYDLGVALKDMEFVQFYPTATGRLGSRPLLYEKLLAQEGVALRDKNGDDIVRKSGITDPTRMTRDQLAQIIMKEIINAPEENRKILMDLSPLSQETAEELSQLVPSSWWKGQKQFEVSPTAHFCMGGVVTDPWGETSQKGLFAAGEVGAGAHGANRLGGNALAEVFSMGSLAGAKAAESALKNASPPPGQEAADHEMSRLEGMFSGQGVRPKDLIRDLKTLMWYKAGIVRQKEALEEALGQLRHPLPRAVAENPGDLITLLEFRNMRLLAEMLCVAAIRRTETRGSHCRVDHPEENDGEWLKNILFRKGRTGMEISLAEAGTNEP